MAIEPIVSWKAPSHIHVEKGQDWYWSVGIIALAISVVCFIFGNIVPGVFVIVATVALVLHASQPAKILDCSVNDRGVAVGDTLYTFLDLDSFCIPHDHYPTKLLLKSRKLFMPIIVVYIEDIDPEEIRQALLKYIAEENHRESILKLLLERFGF